MLNQFKEMAFVEKAIDPQLVRYSEEGLCYDMAIQYGEAEGVPLLMDCFYPRENNGQMPVIVWIHGGGWSDYQYTRVYRPEKELAEMAQMGFFFACIDYRLLDVAPFPAQIQDCKCAVRYLRAHAEELGINPDCIGVWGESAGGHLAALLAVTEGVKEFEGNGGWQEYSSAVQAAVPWYTPCDLTAICQGGGADLMAALMGIPADDPGFAQKLQAASPIHYAQRKLPPMMLMHGDCDSIVPYSQSEDFCRRARDAGNPVRLVTMIGRNHGLVIGGQEYYHAIERFFGQHLMGKQRSFVGGGRVVWETPVDWNAINVEYIPDVTYATVDGFDLKADWMIPREDNGQPRPVVVWFHGGGWRSEDLNRKYRPEKMLAELCRQGFVCLSADYRLLQQAVYPAPIEDARCVIRYVRANAEKYNLNPESIGVMGESAGAATAQLLGTGQYMPHHEGNGGYQEYSSAVQAVCSWYGFSNHIKAAQLSGREHNDMLNVDYDLDGPGAKKLWQESTIAYADRPLPPFLLIHGSADPLVPLWQSIDMYNALVSHGNEAQIHIAPGQVHGFFTDPKTPVVIYDFFNKHLKKA